MLAVSFGKKSFDKVTPCLTVLANITSVLLTEAYW